MYCILIAGLQLTKQEVIAVAESKVVRVTYSLEPEYQNLFRSISRLTRRSMTDELRMMLDARAEMLGLAPISHVDPKSSAPILEMALA